MSTECNGKLSEFHPLGRREVRADFGGGAISSEGGGLLLREVEKRSGIIERFAECFQDHRRRSGSSTEWRSWWRSGYTGWRWDVRI